MPKVDFCEFQEREIQSKVPMDKVHTQKGDPVVGMPRPVACHLGDPLGTSCVGLGNGTDFGV